MQSLSLKGQQDFECHAGQLEAGGSSFLDQPDPSCWPDYSPPCEKNIGFAPNADHPKDTPIKFIRVVLHFFQNWDDPAVIHPPGNFTNSTEHMDVIRSWFHHPVRGINARLANICDPLPKVPGNESPHIPDARVRFLYEGIENEDVFFYNDPELWASGYYCCNYSSPRASFVSKGVTNNPIVRADEDLRNALHVFYTGVSIGPNDNGDCDCATMPSYSGGGYTLFGCSPTNNIVQYATYYTYQYNKTGVSTWVGGVFGTNRIRQSQGLQEEIDNVITYSATGNRFAYTGFDFDNEGEAVDYYYYEQGAQEKPLTFFGITDIEAVENTCPAVYCEPPCKDSGEVAQEKDKYYQDQSKNETAKTEQEAAEASGNTTLADAKAKEASYYRQRMDQEAYMVVLHLMYDTTNFNIDTLATWVENLDLFSTDLIWALRQQSNGKYDEAVATLARASKRDNLSDQDKADLRDMPILLNVMRGKQAHEVGSRHFKTLEEMTINYESFTGNIAKNILRLHGHYFPPVYHFPNRKKLGTENLSFASSQLSEELAVFPNPSNGQFTLHWTPINTDMETARLEIRDLTGRLVHDQQLTAFGQQAIDLSSQSRGIYYYHLRIGNDMPSLSGKLIIQ